MKKIAVAVILLFLTLGAFAQSDDKQSYKGVFNQDFSTFKKFSIGTDFTYDFWLDMPDEMGKTRFNRSSSFFATYNIRIKNSGFYFCPGLGFNFRNLYTSAFPQPDSIKIIDYIPIDESVDYKKSKTTFSYIELPLEMRYSYKRFQVGLGVKVSCNIGMSAKYKGEKFFTDGLLGEETGSTVKVKWSNVPGFERWQFGAQLRVGYSWIHAYVYYGFSRTYKGETEIGMRPVSVGITVMPFR